MEREKIVFIIKETEKEITDLDMRTLKMLFEIDGRYELVSLYRSEGSLTDILLSDIHKNGFIKLSDFIDLMNISDIFKPSH